MLAGKGPKHGFYQGVPAWRTVRKTQSGEEIQPLLQHQIASFGFHLFRQRRTADIIEVQLLAVLRLEQPLQAVQVVSVLLLLCGIQPQLVQNLIFNVFHVGSGRQFLFGAVLQNTGGIIHIIGAERLGTSAEQTG